jgi:hypothetical protein
MGKVQRIYHRSEKNLTPPALPRLQPHPRRLEEAARLQRRQSRNAVLDWIRLSGASVTLGSRAIGRNQTSFG